MKILSLFMMVFVFFSCTGQTNKGWMLKGCLEDVKEGWAYLSELADGEWNIIDSMKIHDGKFEFKCESVDEIKQYYMAFKDPNFEGIYVKNNLPVFVEKGTVEFTGNIKENKFNLIGTPNNEALNDYNRIFHTVGSSLYHTLYEDESWKTDTLQKYVLLGKYYMLAELMPKFRYIYADKYKDLDFSLTIYQEICMMNQDLKASTIDSLLGLVSPSLHTSPFYRDLKNRADKIRTFEPGAVPPDFELPAPDGKTVSLSSFRGKHLILVFWASWCAPCRAEIPHLMKIYEKYNADGLDILSVSVDNKRDAWEKAIAETGMPWTQVSDLKGLKSPVTKLYGVDGVPAVWLIDPEGKVMAYNIRGEELDAQLKKIFGR